MGNLCSGDSTHGRRALQLLTALVLIKYETCSDAFDYGPCNGGKKVNFMMPGLFFHLNAGSLLVIKHPSSCANRGLLMLKNAQATRGIESRQSNRELQACFPLVLLLRLRPLAIESPESARPCSDAVEDGAGDGGNGEPEVDEPEDGQRELDAPVVQDGLVVEPPSGIEEDDTSDGPWGRSRGCKERSGGEGDYSGRQDTRSDEASSLDCTGDGR